jgi:hypothetical protein
VGSITLKGLADSKGVVRQAVRDNARCRYAEDGDKALVDMINIKGGVGEEAYLVTCAVAGRGDISNGRFQRELWTYTITEVGRVPDQTEAVGARTMGSKLRWWS